MTGAKQKGEQLQNAAGLAMPIQVSPGNALVTTPEGKEIYSGMGGLIGYQTALNNLGQAKDYGAQSVQLDTTLKQVDTLAPTIIEFLKNAPELNSERSPWYGKAINTYIASNENPANAKSLALYMAELKKYQGMIMSQSGLTPTEVTGTVLGIDLSNLNVEDLVPFVKNLQNAGQIQLKSVQETALKSRNAGTQPYVGTPATATTTSAYAPNIKSIANDVIGSSPKAKALTGIGMESPAMILGLLQQVIGGLLGK
jgi:hypothetical protein